MKANNRRRVSKDNQAQVGIGTLIIFIAMVLVAAVAAAVLIQTSGVLQQKAQTTGKEATKEVSSNIDLDSIEGWRGGMNASSSVEDTFSSQIYRLDLRASLKVGSEPVDMNQVVITITDGTTTNDLRYIEGDLVTAKALVGSSGTGRYTASAATGITNTTYRILVDGDGSGTTESNEDAFDIIQRAYQDANVDDDFEAQDGNASAGITYSYTDPYVWSDPEDAGSILAVDAGVFRDGVNGGGTSYSEITNSTYHDCDNTTQDKYLMRGDMFFIINEIRDEDKSFTKANPVMNTGDLVKIIILTGPSTITGGESYSGGDDTALTDNYPLTGEADLTLGPRTTVSISMIPEGGASTDVTFVTPSSFGTHSSVDLYP
ncbi:MAG: archaellin/type IV pilin N-terminal domain-containing protein [Euryarchaeota archaeon]|nr:archaellin/type IV pilin N-terminal domain-containing protein [Euryarchaeota archaeon]